MRSPSSTVALRVFLLGAMGALGCGAAASAGERGGLDTTGGDRNPTDAGVTKAGLGGCTHPQPLMAVDTGIFRCDEGFLHRAEARRCPSELPRDRVLTMPAADAGISQGGAAGQGADPLYQCLQDTDCNDPLSRCELIQTNPRGPCFGIGYVPVPPVFEARCIRGCREDSDCGDGLVCVCGSPIGYCQPVSVIAGCNTDADCAGKAQCLSNSRNDNFDAFTFACELAADGCSADDDCPFPNFCRMTESGRSCQGGAVCGRPFIVGAGARLAPARATPGWLGAGTPARGGSVGVRSVPPSLAGQLARRWTEIGLMEHASIAAFARFTLQLLGMGAPLDLIEGSNQAQADEARHARLAFELASAYSGTPVGPGPLSLSGPLLDADWEAILHTTIEEGCIGETCAAIEARLAADLCTDPAVAQRLRSIADYFGGAPFKEDGPLDVPDIDAATRFYTLALGLRIGRRFDPEFVELLGAEAPIYLLRKAAGTPPFQASSQPREYERHWTPLHLDFVVQDLEVALARALAATATCRAPSCGPGESQLIAELMSD